MKDILSAAGHFLKRIKPTFNPREYHYISDHTLRDIGLRRDEVLRPKAPPTEGRETGIREEKKPDCCLFAKGEHAPE